MAITTRLYLSGVCTALALSATAVTFPEVPPTVMLGILGAIFLALASRTHRYAQAPRGQRALMTRPLVARCSRSPRPVDHSPTARGNDFVVFQADTPDHLETAGGKGAL